MLKNVLAEAYNTFSQNTPYQIHPNATTTSKMIDTKQITQRLQQIDSGQLDLKINTQLLANLQIQEEQEQTSLQAQQLQTP
ncbi:10021_t:CDS:2 [Cetraspora pellucida]|uniref:10021_t:CDS:1 n=1 Tax=Cetraspora pellucida TaxID=1433469 RepID=A0ACA9L2J3_9GLOM|nr:10021_t:CDS:2 [Cetraspora pellucida]